MENQSNRSIQPYNGNLETIFIPNFNRGTIKQHTYYLYGHQLTYKIRVLILYIINITINIYYFT